MNIPGAWLRWVVGLMVACLGLSCGQKKIEGPLPEMGDLVLRVMYLVDPALPVLSDTDLRGVLDLSEKQLQSKTSRRVRFEFSGRADLQTEFDRLKLPFGRIGFPSRLDPSAPMPEDSKRVLYARLLELLRTDKLRPLFPHFSLAPDNLNVSLILDTVVQQFERSLSAVRASSIFSSPAFQVESVRDRRSVFNWYTVLGAISTDSRPADLILTNDILIFDSLFSLPPQCLLTAGLTTGYTRPYPGVAVVSTFPVLTDEMPFAVLRGPARPDQRLAILAWSISREVGGKLILMEQDEFSHPDCLSSVWVPPYSQILESTGSEGPCPSRHDPLDRRQLKTNYLSEFVRISSVRKHFDAAKSALDQLTKLQPEDDDLKDLRAFYETVRAKSETKP